MPDKIIRFIIYLLFGLLPWVSLPINSAAIAKSQTAFSLPNRVFSIFLPPDRVAGMHGKFTLIAIFACLIFFLWVVKIILTSEIKMAKTPLDKPILLFVGVVMLSTLFSDDIYKSLLGWDRHREGLAAFAIYALIYFAVVNFIDSKKSMEKLILALSLGVVASNAQGIYQIVTGTTEFGNRVTASFTDPNFYAGFLVMTIPLMVAFTLLSERPYRAVVFGSIGFIALILLFFTFSRIAYVSLVLSLLTIFVFLWLRGKSRYVFSVIAVLLGIFLVAFLLSKFTTLESQAYFLKRISFSSFIEGLQTRAGLWRLSWNYVFDRPLLGSGPDRYRFVTGNSGGYGGAHNEYLYYVVTIGWLGLASFFLLVGIYLSKSIKAVLTKDTFFVLRLGCLAGTIGYLSYIFATYNIPFVAIFFWLLLGVTWLPERFESRSFFRIRLGAFPNWVKGLSIFAATVLSLFMIVQVLRLPMGAFYWTESKKLWAEGQKELALAASRKAVRLVPDSEPYWTDLGGVALYLGKSGRRDLLPLAIISFEKVVSQFNKGESPTWFYLGEAYRLSGEKEKARLAYKEAVKLGTSALIEKEALVILGEQYEQ